VSDRQNLSMARIALIAAAVSASAGALGYTLTRAERKAPKPHTAADDEAQAKAEAKRQRKAARRLAAIGAAKEPTC
jgi:hypothetical protein